MAATSGLAACGDESGNISVVDLKQVLVFLDRVLRITPAQAYASVQFQDAQDLEGLEAISSP